MDSVLAQTFEGWEHLIVDDGPDEETAAFVRERAKADQRIRYIMRQSEESGANVCRNLGLSQARSEFVVFLDDDDLLTPDALSRRFETMVRNQDLDFAVFAGEGFCRRPGDFPPTKRLEPSDDILRFLSLDCPWLTTGPIWRRTYIEAMGGFIPDLSSMQDLELHVRALCSRPRYFTIDTVDHFHRENRELLRTTSRHFSDPLFIEQSERIPSLLSEYMERAGFNSWSRNRALLGLGFGTAERWARIGHLRTAARVWSRACTRFGAPTLIRFSGAAMLCIARSDDGRNGPPGRLLNKWKGWVRFRQEPSLLRATASRR